MSSICFITLFINNNHVLIYEPGVLCLTVNDEFNKNIF